MSRGKPASYSIVLTTQDWIGTQQPLLNVTTTNLIDPFSTRSSDIGNLAGSVLCRKQRRDGHDGPDLLAGVDDPGRLRGRIPADHDNLCQSPERRAQHRADRRPHPARRGGVSAARLEPRQQLHASSAATEDLLGYSTFATATTETIHLQGVSTSGVASASTIAATIANGTWWAISYNANLGAFTFDFYSKTGASGAGLYYQTFDPTTGRLGSPTAFLLTPGFTTRLEREQHPAVRRRQTPVRQRIPGLPASHPGFSRQLDDAGHDFQPGSATPDHYAITAVTDPNDGKTDYTVLAYSDNNQVHLELLNNYGHQIGADYIVPGITSFDRLHSIFAAADNDYRVELDYTVPDPKGGTEVEGLDLRHQAHGQLCHAERRRASMKARRSTTLSSMRRETIRSTAAAAIWITSRSTRTRTTSSFRSSLRINSAFRLTAARP